MEQKGRVCVTGGSGFIASWLIKRLLHTGYSVNTTVRKDSADGKRDLSYLTTLPNASENLTIFEADLDQPDSFAPAIKGCTGVFHVVHPMEWDETEPEETKTKRVIDGLLGILRACIESTTVKRFMHTSSTSAVVFDGKDLETRDEDMWTDIDFIRNLGLKGNSYAITKTLAERTALEFGQEHGLDVISLLPTWVHGPFFIPRCPNSVLVFLALILGDENYYKFLVKTSLVHVDDVVRAFIHLFEFPEAEGSSPQSRNSANISHQFHRNALNGKSGDRLRFYLLIWLRRTVLQTETFEGKCRTRISPQGQKKMKVKILQWHVVASWTWDAQDETCGICRMAFDGCCPDCKLPGDDCPLI